LKANEEERQERDACIKKDHQEAKSYEKIKIKGVVDGDRGTSSS